MDILSTKEILFDILIIFILLLTTIHSYVTIRYKLGIAIIFWTDLCDLFVETVHETDVRDLPKRFFLLHIHNECVSRALILLVDY